MVKAQEWLYENYSMKNKKNITELDISNQNLEGKLDLSDFENLEELNCSNNPLESLDISRLRKLEKLNIINTNINFCGKHLANVPLKELNGRSFAENYRKLWLEKTVESAILKTSQELTSNLQNELRKLLNKQEEVTRETDGSKKKILNFELEKIKSILIKESKLSRARINDFCETKNNLTKLQIQDGQSTEQYGVIEIDLKRLH